MSDEGTETGLSKKAAEVKRQAAKDLRRAQLKETAILRADFNLAVALKRVDFTLDVVEVRKKEIAADAAQGELPEFTIEGDPTDEG